MKNIKTFFDEKKVLVNTIPTNLDLTYTQLSDVVKTYTSEGYSCMTHDKIRNAAYSKGISDCLALLCASKPRVFVTEIGPGADACLVKMVLDCSSSLTYVGLEGNAKSTEQCIKTLKGFGYDKNTYKIINIMSNDPSIEITNIYKQTDILLHELIGFIASREGLVAVLHDICHRNGGILPTTVPDTVATFLTPTFVDAKTFKSSLRTFAQGVMRVNHYPQILLMQPFPFDEKNVAPFFPECSTLEFFDCSAGASIDKHIPQKFTTLFTASREGICVNSITAFVWVGFNGIANKSNIIAKRTSRKSTTFPTLLYQPDLQTAMACKPIHFSTCNALPPTSQGWPNVILLLDDTIEMPIGSTLQVFSSVKFTTDIPIYTWDISLKHTDASVSHCQTFVFS
jgi:hypothetical protein